MKASSLIGLVFVFFYAFGLSPAAGPANGAAQVFEPALTQIRGQTRIPILLPSKLPAAIRVPDVKLAWGKVLEDGYWISLYYAEVGSEAEFAAAFGGSRSVIGDLPNTRPVVLAGGITGMFRPVSCGGSCAPANLWWERDGVVYQIQIKLRSTTSEPEQERILLEAANSSVAVGQR